MKKYKFLKPIDKSGKIERIDAKEGPWIQDSKGYFLIKIDKDKMTINVGHCTNDNVLRKEIIGKRAQDIYYTIAKLDLVSIYTHASYLGKELKKAEIALKLGVQYTQDEDIDFNKIK
jgi:tetrahydromethanopterin S-methyltransferase subunit A